MGFALTPNLLSQNDLSKAVVYWMHCCLFVASTFQGLLFIKDKKGIVEDSFYASVFCLVIIGCFFLMIFVMIAFIVLIVIVVDTRESRLRRERFTAFQTEFNEIEAVIYSEDLRLRNRQCAICLVHYLEGEIVKVLPKCLHTYHN